MACDGKPHLRLGPPQGMSTNPDVSVVMSVYNGASHPSRRISARALAATAVLFVVCPAMADVARPTARS